MRYALNDSRAPFVFILLKCMLKCVPLLRIKIYTCITNSYFIFDILVSILTPRYAEGLKMGTTTP